MREIKSVILHCTATTLDKELSVKEIRRWHTDPPPKGRGWSDIGYHFLIHQDGTIERGRHIDKVGAHTWGNNYGSVGVAYCGGVEKKIKKSLDKEKPKSKTTYEPKDTMTKAQEKSFRDLFVMLEVFFGELKLRGHNDYTNQKACPSFNMRDKFGDLINR
jgi:N-acetylmuramoyl-L-alanine amidase